MPLTPLDIEKKEFKRVFRGYSEEEVDDFLDLVIRDYEALYRENLDLKERLQLLEEQLQQYQRLEETLKNTLVLAEKTAEEVKNNAHQEAELILREAQERAAKLQAQAQERVQEIQKQYQQEKERFKVFLKELRAKFAIQTSFLAELEENLK